MAPVVEHDEELAALGREGLTGDGTERAIESGEALPRAEVHRFDDDGDVGRRVGHGEWLGGSRYGGGGGVN